MFFLVLENYYLLTLDITKGMTLFGAPSKFAF